jgi:hypothetical protein
MSTSADVAAVAAVVAAVAAVAGILVTTRSARKLDRKQAATVRDAETQRALTARDLDDRREIRSLLARFFVRYEEMLQTGGRLHSPGACG